MAEADDEAWRLRRRAAELRDVAGRVDRSTIHELLARSGPATWIGPTATWFDEVARACSRAADESSNALRVLARHLEERANEVVARRAAERAPLAG
jgi:uncharacterized protein YukE